MHVLDGLFAGRQAGWLAGRGFSPIRFEENGWMRHVGDDGCWRGGRGLASPPGDDLVGVQWVGSSRMDGDTPVVPLTLHVAPQKAGAGEVRDMIHTRAYVSY